MKKLDNPKLAYSMARERWERELKHAREEYDIEVSGREEWQQEWHENDLIDVHYHLEQAWHESRYIQKIRRQMREREAAAVLLEAGYGK